MTAKEEINHTALKSVYKTSQRENQLGSDHVCLTELLIIWCANFQMCVCEHILYGLYVSF